MRKSNAKGRPKGRPFCLRTTQSAFSRLQVEAGVGRRGVCGVEAAAWQAFEAGYNVTLAIDAMSDMRAEAQACSLANVFPRLGESGR
jgi:hypothetical protein